MREGTLIPPIPKEYLTYSDREKLEKTEKYYQKIDGLYQRMDASKNGYRQRLDYLLKNKAAVSEINEALMEKEAQILCLYDYEFYVFKMLCQIAEKEAAFNVPIMIKSIQNMEEAVYWQQRCVFLLRRFEFEWEEDDELLLLMQENKVSYIYLAELICGEGIVRKVYAASRITQYLYVNGLMREALLFLMWLERQLPYSERKIMVFAMTLLGLGERKLAYEILIKHKSPDEEIKNLQTELAGIL